MQMEKCVIFEFVMVVLSSYLRLLYEVLVLLLVDLLMDFMAQGQAI